MLNEISLHIVYPHIFNNEFNNRTIVSIEEDKNFSTQCLMAYLNSNKWYFDLSCYGNRGREIYDNKCKYYQSLKATLVHTIDKDGVKEIFRFWMDNGKNCYSQIG